jgi:hypothetical protein
MALSSIYNALVGLDQNRVGQIPVVNVTAATLTVTPNLHAGAIVTLNRAGGIAVTLPNAIGSFNAYTFVNVTALSSASHTFTRGNSADVMIGIANIGKAAGNMTPFVALAAGNFDTVTLNGTTSGGLGSDELYFVDIALNQWFISFNLWGSGTLVTPFSNT